MNENKSAVETVALRNGMRVTASNGSPKTYANRTQAKKAAAKLGGKWSVWNRGNPVFYVAEM